jgi:hypothetical protein
MTREKTCGGIRGAVDDKSSKEDGRMTKDASGRHHRPNLHICPLSVFRLCSSSSPELPVRVQAGLGSKHPFSTLCIPQLREVEHDAIVSFGVWPCYAVIVQHIHSAQPRHDTRERHSPRPRTPSFPTPLGRLAADAGIAVMEAGPSVAAATVLGKAPSGSLLEGPKAFFPRGPGPSA